MSVVEHQQQQVFAMSGSGDARPDFHDPHYFEAHEARRRQKVSGNLVVIQLFSVGFYHNYYTLSVDVWNEYT